MNAVAKRTTAMAAAVVLMGAVSACENVGQKTQIGAAGGAAAGGLLGAAVGGGATGIAAGVLLGGLAGGALGNMLDQRDQELQAQQTQQALESQRDGQQSQWVNPNSGHSGTINPTNTYQNASGQYCREFTQTVTVDGRTETTTGTACRDENGNWRIV